MDNNNSSAKINSKPEKMVSKDTVELMETQQNLKDKAPIEEKLEDEPSISLS
jgi:hypothetical protein